MRQWIKCLLCLPLLGAGDCGPSDVEVLQGDFSSTVGPARDGIHPPPDYEPEFKVGGGCYSLPVSGTLWGDACGDEIEAVFLSIDGALHLFVNLYVEHLFADCPDRLAETAYEARFVGIRDGLHDVYVHHKHQRLGVEKTYRLGFVSVTECPTTHVGTSHALGSVTVDPIFPQ